MMKKIALGIVVNITESLQQTVGLLVMLIKWEKTAQL